METNGENSNLQIHHEYHSDVGNSSSSSPKITFQHSTSTEHSSNKQLIPLHTRNQTINSVGESKYINSKIVLFIQMQPCDTTLYDWLRYRDITIIEETSDEIRTIFYSLNDLGQHQCWNIFKQLLTAVEVKIKFCQNLLFDFLHSSIFIPDHLFIGI